MSEQGSRRTWLRLSISGLLACVACAAVLFNFFRPLGQGEIIRVAARYLEKAYPGEHFVPRQAFHSSVEPNVAWEVTFEASSMPPGRDSRGLALFGRRGEFQGLSITIRQTPAPKK